MKEAIEIAPGIVATGSGALYLPATRTVIIADVHLGYARAARRRGGYLPAAESVETTISRILRIIEPLAAQHLIVAGDVRHSTRDVDAAELAEVVRFTEVVSSVVTLTLVAGNHDRGSQAPSSVMVEDVCVTHAPPRSPPAQWTVCGHLHPTAVIRDETGASARFPCYLIGPRLCILPAFTAWAGGTPVARLLPTLPPGPWRQIVVSDEQLYEM